MVPTQVEFPVHSGQSRQHHECCTTMYFGGIAYDSDPTISSQLKLYIVPFAKLCPGVLSRSRLFTGNADTPIANVRYLKAAQLVKV